MNPQQGQAVNIGTGPALVVAGAGTGKTRVIIERLRRLIASGVSPGRLLGLTFTEKAATEMQDRINSGRVGVQPDLPIMTFNAYGESLLRRYANDIGLVSNFRLIGDEGRIVFLRERLDKLKLDYFSPVARPDALLGELTAYFSRLKQNVISPGDYQAFAQSIKVDDDSDKFEKKKQTELALAYKTYVDLCRAEGIIDYDDQIYLVIELFKKRPNVLAEVQSEVDYVMVDEFQDTNLTQAQLVDSIVARSRNLVVVGDDDQSIYGWRGATLDNILDFKRRYPKAKEVSLITNYRSTKQILASAHKLIKHNDPYRLESRLKINKRIVSERAGSQPKANLFESLEAELAWVTQDIKNRLLKGSKPGDIAVLARRHNSLRLLSENLHHQGLPHILSGQKFELYTEPAVANLIEALRTIIDPLDNRSLYHTLTGPLFEIPVNMISSLAKSSGAEHRSLLEAIEESSDRSLSTARKATKQLKTWQQKSATLRVGQLAYEIIDDSGYKERLYNQALDDEQSAKAVNRLAEFFTSLKNFEQVAILPSANRYLEALPALEATDDLRQDDTEDLSEEVVNLLTVHKAKGLEWPIVYIIDCVEGSFPLANRPSGLAIPEKLHKVSEPEANDHIREERRLMYVAMTRAKDQLTLTYSLHHGSTTLRKPSRFINETFENKVSSIKNSSLNLPALGQLRRQSTRTQALQPLPKLLFNNNKLVLSVSQIINYQSCPLDFYYRYVLGVPQPDSPAKTYGRVMHHLIELINRGLLGNKPINKARLRAELDSSWPKAGFDTLAQNLRARRQLEATVMQILDKSVEPSRKLLLAEEAFRVSLPDIELIMRGRFDAIFESDDGVEIVDYKTGSSVDSKEKARSRARSNEQLTLYALAWQLNSGQIPAKVTLKFVDTGYAGSVQKTEKGISGVVSRLATVADGIKNGHFPPGARHLNCLHPRLPNNGD